MDTRQKPVTGLLMDLIDGVSRLARQELQLARAEGEEKISAATTGVVSIAVGLSVALVALLVLVQAVVVALAKVVPAAIAALIVGVVLALIAFILIRKGQSNLKAKNLALRKTAASLRQDKNMVMETVG